MKIGNKIRWADKMAAPVSLTIDGDFTHSTLFGGVCTILAYLAVGAWYAYATTSSLTSIPAATLQIKPSNSVLPTTPSDTIASSEICVVAGWLPSANGNLAVGAWNLTIYF